MILLTLRTQRLTAARGVLFRYRNPHLVRQIPLSAMRKILLEKQIEV